MAMTTPVDEHIAMSWLFLQKCRKSLGDQGSKPDPAAGATVVPRPLSCDALLLTRRDRKGSRGKERGEVGRKRMKREKGEGSETGRKGVETPYLLFHNSITDSN